MEYYIEFTIINNLLVDYILLYLTAISTNIKTNRLKIIISSAFGTLIAVLFTFAQISAILNLFVAIAVAFIMIFILKRPENFIKYICSVCVFYSFAFLIGGAINYCFGLVNISSKYGNSLSLTDLVPFGVIAIILFIFCKSIVYVAKTYYKKRQINEYIYTLTVTFKDKSIRLDCFLDSGNMLKDTQTGKPVIIISTKNIKNLFGKKFNLEEIILKTNASKLPYNTLSGTYSNMYVFDADKIEVETDDGTKQQISAKIGLIEKDFKYYDGIIGVTVLKDNKNFCYNL